MIDPPIQVFGYHGTSRQKANAILSQGFRVSDNDYDWLGEGVYFFQDAPYRAMQWATQQHPQNPAVIRAVIQLELHRSTRHQVVPAPENCLQFI
jgi:hypothetical protein